MEYHNDRFQDHSLLVWKGDKLVAVVPLNVTDKQVHSHQGLSYGGLVLPVKIKFAEVLEITKAILVFLASEGIVQLNYKVIPRIYHSHPSDEMDYLLFLLKANCYRSDITSAIDLQNPIKIQSNRMEGVKKAQKLGLVIKEDGDYTSFWNKILIPNLQRQHNASPVHTAAEIEFLAHKFPKNISQFNVYHNEKIVGGATIFETPHLVHVQYISGDENKQQLGSLDFLFHFLITERFAKKKYFDFGISNENKGMNINGGLMYWKECFGARAFSNQFYSIPTANHILLEQIIL